MAELYLKSATGAPRKLTDLNAEVLRGKEHRRGRTSVTFISNDNGSRWRHFSPSRSDLTADSQASPHRQHSRRPARPERPGFNFKQQVYAGRGWATLNVNYRGSTGYGQKFADAVFADQDGNEGQDVLYGVSAAVRRNLWIDRDRMGIEGVSYGGQLSDWLITQTNEFKAAIPIAGISNLDQLQLHDLLQPVRGDGVRAVPAPGQSDGCRVGAFGAEARGRTSTRRRC